MSDIRKRAGKTGTNYQVRYRKPGSRSGYAYATFKTRKEAQAFLESGQTQTRGQSRGSVRTVHEAVDRWSEICRVEGRDGRDPITAYTEKTYERRAAIIKAYDWTKPLRELETPDVVAFRSWLLQNYSRHQAHKALSSFHGVIKEMSLRGEIAANVAAGVSIRADSRYTEKVVIPAPQDVQALLDASDRLANSKNQRIAKTWRRYRLTTSKTLHSTEDEAPKGMGQRMTRVLFTLSRRPRRVGPGSREPSPGKPGLGRSASIPDGVIGRARLARLYWMGNPLLSILHQNRGRLKSFRRKSRLGEGLAKPV